MNMSSGSILFLSLVAIMTPSCKPRVDGSLKGKDSGDNCSWAASKKAETLEEAVGEQEKRHFIAKQTVKGRTPELKATATALLIENGKGTPPDKISAACACNNLTEMQKRIAEIKPGTFEMLQIEGIKNGVIEMKALGATPGQLAGEYAKQARLHTVLSTSGAPGVALALATQIQSGVNAVTLETGRVSFPEMMVAGMLVAMDDAVLSGDEAEVKKIAEYAQRSLSGASGQAGLPNFSELRVPGASASANALVSFAQPAAMERIQALPSASERLAQLSEGFKGVGLSVEKMMRIAAIAERTSSLRLEERGPGKK